MLKAGVAISEITPKEPLFLAGYPEPADRFGNSVHDPLYCSAYYIGSNEEIIMLCLDLCNVTKKQTRQIREGINKATGVKKENISVSCTHTHSGPTTTSINFSIYNEDKLMYPEYMESCVNTVIETAIKAFNSKFDAQIGFGSAICGKDQNIGGNRHFKDGPADEQIFALSIKGQRRGDKRNHHFLFFASDPSACQQLCVFRRLSGIHERIFLGPISGQHIRFPDGNIREPVFKALPVWTDF